MQDDLEEQESLLQRCIHRHIITLVIICLWMYKKKEMYRQEGGKRIAGQKKNWCEQTDWRGCYVRRHEA